MATKGMNFTTPDAQNQHTVTYSAGSTLSDALLVAYDDTKITTNDDLLRAIEAARRAITQQMSEKGDPQKFPTSGSESY